MKLQTKGLDDGIISGLTAESSPASDDLLMVYDDSASALRKMTRENFLDSVFYNAGLTVNGTYSGETCRGTVDANGTGFGAALYIASDFNYEEADADAAATMPCTALALEAGTGSNKLLLTKGYICNTSWNWSAGKIFVDTTTGALTQTKPTGSGDVVQCVGYARSADTMFFNPSMDDLELA